ncbi:pyridoxal phosphate-dependent aminotransferase [Candidatus Xianfuyuplasma coldseepsis]|uniref:Histidinol-phosphate aminotransferase family protein n=1 Tax=Candidatus Xianfuyuplasma coldseepsis TaxID=2782163 RepID=A0A7L7KPR0_9MOLU|nr:histidinol-phosphate transaminase [Xianfuyuplasma coldseepsis]QMS84781.1 histidinol-phosphate aminotransferase family protein [Xianfuyuplasma coldseepsis]
MKTNKYITSLIPYSSKKVDASILLNANETTNYLFPDGIRLDYDIERYPIKTPQQLINQLADKYSVPSASLILGNGSTELLELSTRTFTDIGDIILTLDPSFSMYTVYSQVVGCTLKTVSVFQPIESIFTNLRELNQQFNPSIVFICNPNNPTGTLLPRSEILSFVKETDALVIVDEAYMEFANEQESVALDTKTYDNLLVARTFSKAYGLASLRLGYMIGSPSTITTLSKAKLPYSLNEVTARIGLQALEYESRVQTFVSSVITERDKLYQELQQLPLKVQPSFTNFFFVESTIDLQSALLNYGILIRSFRNGTYRITIGTKDENKQLLIALQEVLS